MSWFLKILGKDGVSQGVVKAASTAPVATDEAVVVAISPNTPAYPVKATGNAGAAFDSATGAAVPANAVLMGLRAATSNPANATGGNIVAPMGDHAGRQVVTHVQVRELVGVQQTNVAASVETTLLAAGGAGVFNDIIGLIITTAGLAAQTITVKDATAGTTRMVLNYPNAAVAPASPLVIMFTTPVPQAVANNNWTVTQSLGTACNYTVLYAKNT